MTLDFHGSTPDLYELKLLAERAAATVTAGELHGALCGVFAGGGTQIDLIELVGEDALTDQDSVSTLWHACMTVAFSHDLDFAPVLDADDEAQVAERVNALAQWSATFLAGYTRLIDPEEMSGQAREIVRDLTAVAQADTDVDDSDANEADFVELYEFVRVAGLLLFADAIDVGADADETVH